MLSFDELIGSLQAHEARLNRLVEKSEENAFHVKGEASKQQYEAIRGCGRGISWQGSRGRGS